MKNLVLIFGVLAIFYSTGCSPVHEHANSEDGRSNKVVLDFSQNNCGCEKYYNVQGEDGFESPYDECTRRCMEESAEGSAVDYPASFKTGEQGPPKGSGRAKAVPVKYEAEKGNPEP